MGKDSKHLAVPSFATDMDKLREIGIIAKAKKTKYSSPSAKGIRRKKKVTFDGKIYEWRKDGKYRLNDIVSHKLENDLDIVLADDKTDTKLWYQSIGYTEVMDALKEKLDIGMPDGDAHPQCVLGRLMFECKWEGWPDTTWETWTCIKSTQAMKDYCALSEHDWNVENELGATIMEYPADELKKVLQFMSVFTNKKTRKSLKIVFDRNYTLW